MPSRELQLSTPTLNWPYVGTVYSNCDHELDKEVLAKLDKGGVTAGHPAWNFHGTIWKHEGKFYEYVMRHLVHVATFEGDEIMDVIRQANARFGND